MASISRFYQRRDEGIARAKRPWATHRGQACSQLRILHPGAVQVVGFDGLAVEHDVVERDVLDTAVEWKQRRRGLRRSCADIEGNWRGDRYVTACGSGTIGRLRR